MLVVFVEVPVPVPLAVELLLVEEAVPPGLALVPLVDVLPVTLLPVLVPSAVVPLPVESADPPVDELVPLVDGLPVFVLVGGCAGGVTGVLRLMPMDSTLSMSPPSWFKLPTASPKRSLVTNTRALVLLVLGVNSAV